jgi:hypothetical protein
MSMLEEILEDNPDCLFLKADGFDDAVVGCDPPTERLIYSFELAQQILMKDEQMEEIDAIEHLNFNVVNTYVGEKTPIWVM